MSENEEFITVYLPVWAEYSVRVKLDPELDRDEAVDAAIDEAYEKLPSGLCHSCSHGNDGRGFTDDHEVYLELGDDPEVQYASTDDGSIVWGNPDKKTGF